MDRDETHQPRIPTKGTDAYDLYLQDYRRLEEFVGFIFFLASTTDKIAVTVAETQLDPDLVDDSLDEEKKASRRRIIEEKGVGHLKRLLAQLQLILQTMLCRNVDNFLTYLSQLLSLIFRTKPETLRSNEQIKVDFALQYSTMDDLVDAIAEKKVTDLSYAGMRQLSDYLRDRLGLELFTDEPALERAIFLIEVRNLIVHNRWPAPLTPSRIEVESVD
jgi:hypothetical protein